MSTLNPLQMLSSNTGIRHDEIVHLANYFNFSDDLYSIQPVIQNINNIIKIEHLIIYPETQVEKICLNSFERLVSDIKSKLDVMAIPKEWKPHGMVRRKKLITDFPVYAMFSGDGVAYGDKWNSLKEEYTLLMFLIIKSYVHLVESGRVTNPNKNHVLGTRSIRFLENEENRVSIPPAPSSFLNLYGFAESLEDWNQEHDMIWAQDFLSMANSLLYEKEGYERRYRTEINHVGVNKIFSDHLRSDDTTAPNLSNSVNLTVDVPDDHTKNKTRNTGTHHAEYSKTVSMQLTGKVPATRDDRVSNRETKAILNSIIKCAQPVSTTPSELTAFELQTLLNALHFLPLQNGTKGNDIEIQTLILLSLYTGLDIEKIQTLRFLNSKQFINSTQKFLTWDNEQEILFLPINSPDVFKKLSAQSKKLISVFNNGEMPNDKHEYYSIRLPNFASKLLKQFHEIWEVERKTIQKKSESKTPAARTMAFMDTTKHEDDVGFFLGSLNRKHSINLSRKKIQNSFRSALFNHHNDQAVYTLITGAQYGHGIVSSHYYSTEQYLIGDFHAKTINEINKIALVNDSARNDFLELYSVGSKFPINPEMVSLSIEYMLKNLSYAAQLSIDQYHNTFTSYIITMLGFATGYRAVTNPIEVKHQIDFDFKLITISDKDNVNGFHTRVVPIPAVLVEQLKVYEDYLKKLRLRINKPYLYQKIQDLLNGQKSTLSYLFFLGTTLNPNAISPKKIEEYIEPALGLLPYNINRHYLRSQLSKLGCEYELIDYFMGHWELGEEPYNKHSFVSPSNIRDTVLPYIEKIMDRDGWKVVNHRYG